MPADQATRTVPLVRIFLSSPGDVAEEREAAREFIKNELQYRSGFRDELALQVIAWDDPAARIPMLANGTPQESVNAARPRPATCDIVIVILWSRMGTPLPDTTLKPDGARYLSGTEWEYEDAVNSPRKPPPQVLLYRRTEEPMISARDRTKMAEALEQLDRVEAFFARFRNPDGSLKGGVNEYAAAADFKPLLRQHLDEILHRLLPRAHDHEDQAPPLAAVIPSAYLEWLRGNLERVELLGAKEGRSVTLNHVYVPALTRPPPPAEGRKQSGQKQREEEEEQKPIPLLQRLDAASLYVPAPAGAGKSTFCRWAALQSIPGAELSHPVPPPAEFAESEAGTLRARLPLLVPLREFWRSMDCGHGEREWKRPDLEQALSAWVDRSPPPGLAGALLEAHLEAGSAFVLLDGLDEVPVSERRDGVTVYPRALLLSGLADALPAWQKAGNRVLLTSRPYGLDEAGLHRLGLPSAPLEPLPKALQDLFITRWFHTLGKPEKTPDLIATIGARDDVAPLVENPMLLSALCVLYDNGGRLPDDRYDLYKSIVAGVLHNRYPGDASERDPVERRLEAIAYGMHVGDEAAPRTTPAAEVSWIEAERLLARFASANPVYEREQVEAAVRREELLNQSGLLVPRSNQRAGFYHLSFQEFLAAQRLARTGDALDRMFRERSATPEWRSTLLFLFAAQIAIKDAQWGLDLLQRLIAEQDRAAVKANPAPAVFIAEALELCLAKKYAVPERLTEDFRRLVLAAIEDEIELQWRQALGLCLGRLGDPRIFDLRDVRAYVEVPGGLYPYGDKAETVEIKAPFLLGKYPVTNSQYRAFLEDGGYARREYWSDAGWAWRQKEEATEPTSWRDRRWNGPNQPVVGVSFWEAEACCRWAGGRLPKEREWEAAARGPEGVVYPWGNDWEDGICNSEEAGLGVTSTVGLFPRSRQARLGLEDLAGNVWEWCDDLYEKGAVPRVLRGGSYNDSSRGLRAAGRDGGLPVSWGRGNGFRCVLAPPRQP